MQHTILVEINGFFGTRNNMQTNFKLSDDFERVVSINKYAEPDRFELKIQTKRAGAKNPDELRNEFQWIATGSDLKLLQEFISKNI